MVDAGPVAGRRTLAGPNLTVGVVADDSCATGSAPDEERRPAGSTTGAAADHTVAKTSVQDERGTVRTPGSVATAASHGGRTTAAMATAMSSPDNVLA